MSGLTLHAYSDSVYCWIVRFALAAKGVAFAYREINPFTDRDWTRHPFGKVPLLETPEGDIHETAAITRYIDEAFDGPALMPKAAFKRARASQTIALIDAEAYWPLVHPIAAEGYFKRREGRAPSLEALDAGLSSAPLILSVLEKLLPTQGLVATGRLSLADIHAAPVIDYALLAPEARDILTPHPALAGWLSQVSVQPAFRKTRPDPPALS